MHRCLHILEIMEAVVKFLPHSPTEMLPDYDCPLLDNDPYIGDVIVRRDVLAFALTCRTFLNPGLNALWHSMGSVVPLLDLLPSDIRFESCLTTNSVQHIEVPDTRRFDFYAHRIRILCVHHEDVSSFLYRCLSVTFSRSERLVTPNLLHLTWKWIDAATFPCITLFASPVLQCLTLFPFSWKEPNDDFIFSSVSSLVARSSRLHHVTMHDELEFVPSGARETVLLASAFPYLTSVAIRAPTPISVELITVLADMPKLRILQLDYVFTKPLEIQRPLQPGLRFAALEEVELEGGQLQGYIHFFEALRGEHGIKRINVDFKGCATRSSLARFIQAVSSKVSRDTLSQFHMFAAKPCGSHTYPSHAIDNQTLSPLLEFRQMEHFSLNCCAFAWDDQLLEGMALAWPALKSLELHPHSAVVQTSKLTLGGLHPLAKHCPRLNYIDTTIAPFDGDTGQLPQRDWVQLAVHQRSADLPMIIYIHAFRRELHPGLAPYLQSIFPLQPAGHVIFNNTTIL